MKTVSGLTAVAFLLTVAACGGETTPQEFTRGVDYSGPTITPQNQDLTVAELAGVWHYNVGIEGIDGEILSEDEIHVVITEQGDYIEYDYLGDSFAVDWGNFDHCYVKSSFTLEKRPEGGFIMLTSLDESVSLRVNTNFELDGENLLSAGRWFFTDCKCQNPVISVPPSEYTQEALESMLCE